MLLLLEGHLAARYESRPMMFFFALGLVAALVYFSYKVIRLILAAVILLTSPPVVPNMDAKTYTEVQEHLEVAVDVL